MSSKRKMAEEENEHSEDNLWKKPTREKNKSAKRMQKFKIHYTEFLTAANRDERKKTSVTLELNEDTREGEIRNSLVSEFSQLKDKNFTFFTKDKEGKWYYCPCKPKCNEDHFRAEWNARNVAMVVKEDRPVHILVEDVSELDESSSGYGTTVLPDNHRSPDHLEDEVHGAGSLVDYVTNEVSSEPPLEIKQIVPQEGKVEGGYTFFLELKVCCVDEFKVQFGETDPIDVERINEMTYKGTVPASSSAGVVEVKIVKTLPNLKNIVTFTYVDDDPEKKPDFRELLRSMDAAEMQDLLMATAERVGQMSVKSNEEETRYGDSGGGKNHSLPLLRMIAETAARINAITFFEILFRTPAGCTLFKSFKDSQPPLEEIAKLNGHTELALMLEKKHLMFRDDESDSDNEVDWKAISEKIGEHHAKRDESVEKWSLQSTDSSKNVHGYLADRENSSSLSSLQVHVSETYNEGSLEKAFEMGGDHKFLEGKIKLIVRPYSEPVLFPFDDKFSPNEVESLRKKLTSCSTKHIDNNEACCKSLSVGDLDGYPKATEITVERKSFLERSERKELQRLSDYRNFYNSRCHSDVVWSLKTLHIPGTPLCYEEEDPLEIDEKFNCVSVNDSSTVASPTDNSSLLNNRGRKAYVFRMCFIVTVFFSVFTIIATAIVFGSKVRGHKTSSTLKSVGPCSTTQNLVKYEDGSLSCIECPLCPPGLGLSIECGSSTPLSASISVECIPCPLGVSFSSDNDTSICTPCSSCADIEKVQRNCSRMRDTKCAVYCSEKDSHNKCSTTTAITPSSATTGNSHREDSNFRIKIWSIIFSLSLLLGVILSLSATIFWCKVREVARGSLGGAKDRKKRTQIFFGPESSRLLLEKGVLENLEDAQICKKKDSKLLSSLLECESYWYLKKICVRLDTTMAGAGDYRDVCFHYDIDRYEIASVYERHSDGPSRALIDHLAATHVQLTVADFVGVVRNVAGRDDVAELLEEYDLQKE